MTRRGCAIAALLFAACGLANQLAHAGEWTSIAFEQASPKGMRCWYVLPSRIVADDADLPYEGKPREFILRAARNEHECVQLVLLRTAQADNVAVQFSDFTTRAGDSKFTAANFHANKLGQVTGTIAQRSPKPLATWDMIAPDVSPATVTPAMYLPSSGKMIPDRLLPAERFDLDVGITRIWLSVHVPADAAAGDYRGVVKLIGHDGQTLHELPLTLRVWNFQIPDEPGLNVMADVRPTAQLKSWRQLAPFYDDLKAHRINATGEILPAPLWRSDQPPPNLDEYENALKHVLDELKFARFRFPGGAEMSRRAEFDAPAIASTSNGDGVWIVEPPPHVEPGPTLAKYSEQDSVYSVDNPFNEPAWLWLQVDPTRLGEEQKTLAVDGKEVGAIDWSQFASHPLGLAALPQPIELSAGRHELHITSSVTRPAAVRAIFLSPQQDPDFEKLLRERAALSPAARELIRYHADQMSDWLRARGWLKKAHIRLEENASPADFGRVAILHDYIGQVLPTVRREIAAEPTAALRRMTEVWTPDLGRSPHFDVDQWQQSIEPGQELWASHQLIGGVGMPPIAMRLLPWTIARHGLDGLVLGTVNRGADALITVDAATGRPVDSIRFELLREGLEDFETLRMLRGAIDAAVGRNERDPAMLEVIGRGQKLFDETIPGLVRSARDFTWDAAAVQSARDEAGELLNTLTQ